MTEENANAESQVNIKVPDISKYSLLERWLSKEIPTEAGLSVEQVSGNKIVSYRAWLAQVICEPAPGYYLIQIYKAGKLGQWDEDYQELKHINDLQRHKLYSTIDQAVEPFKVLGYELGPNSLVPVEKKQGYSAVQKLIAIRHLVNGKHSGLGFEDMKKLNEILDPK